MSIALIRAGSPTVVTTGENTAEARRQAAIATEAAATATAALASIIADPDVDELATTNTIEAADSIVVYRAGVPTLFTGNMMTIDANGTHTIGDSGVNNSFNASLVISREIDMAASGDNAHDLSISTQITDMGGFAYSGFDNRGNILAGSGNHIVGGVQANWTWESSGTLADYYGVFDLFEMTDGHATRVTGVYLNHPLLSGGATIGNYRGIYVADMDEYNGVPATDTVNYSLQSVGDARLDHQGKARFGSMLIGPSDGAHVEIFNLETQGTDDMLMYIGIAGVWNWRMGMDYDANVELASRCVWKSNDADVMALDRFGNLIFGSGVSLLRPASATNAIVMFNGTAPSANIAGATIWAEGGEAKVRDGAGNVTTFSPHNFSLIPGGASEDLAWAYYSEREGVAVNADMLRALRLLEDQTGEQLVWTEELPLAA